MSFTEPEIPGEDTVMGPYYCDVVNGPLRDEGYDTLAIRPGHTEVEIDGHRYVLDRLPKPGRPARFYYVPEGA